MSNCTFFDCPHYDKSSCFFTVIGGVWKCTRELDGKTITVRSNTTGTGPITKFVGKGTGASE